jgi:uncharacterized membrane protein
MSESGIVVGYSTYSSRPQRAVFWNESGVVDLGSLGEGGMACSIAYGIDIVGFSDLPQGQGSHGFFWRDATMTDAGALPGHSYSQLDAVNNHGVAVGLSHNNDQWPMTATLYLDGRIVALNDLVDDRRGVYVTAAAGIDDADVIVGPARIFGSDRAVLLRPK